MPPRSSATPLVMVPTTSKSASTAPIAYSKRNRDKLAKAGGVITDIHSSKEARDLLQQDAYLEKNTGITPNKIAYALLKYTANTSGLATSAVNFMRAIAFTIEELDHENAIGGLTETMAEKAQEALNARIEEPIARIEAMLKKMEEQEERLKETAASATNTVDELRLNANLLATQRQGAAENTDEVHAEGSNQPSGPRQAGRTYADATRDRVDVPAEHAATIAKGDIKEKQIVIQADSQEGSQQLAALSERELVEKANVALDLMSLDPGERPEGAAFVSALKTRAGSVIYALNSDAAAKYLRRDKNMREFTRHYGGTAMVSPRTCQLVIEYVPADFQPSDQGALRRIEQASGLPDMSICEARWIKPAHLRNEGQKFAFLILGTSTRDAANHALEYGIIIEGRPCKARKSLPEPKRCMKCQVFGHIAKECKSIHDVCARCAGMHRTNDPACTIGGKEDLKCANCKGVGHSAADRTCQVFRDNQRGTHARNPDAKYRLFPTAEPKTWDKMGQEAPRTNTFDNAWQKDDRRTGANTTILGNGAARKGKGRLVGGSHGQGGGAGPSNTARPAKLPTTSYMGTQVRLDDLWQTAGPSRATNGPENPSWADDQRTELDPLPIQGAAGRAEVTEQEPATTPSGTPNEIAEEPDVGL
jgi:hypothetical protein